MYTLFKRGLQVPGAHNLCSLWKCNHSKYILWIMMYFDVKIVEHQYINREHLSCVWARVLNRNLNCLRFMIYIDLLPDQTESLEKLDFFPLQSWYLSLAGAWLLTRKKDRQAWILIVQSIIHGPKYKNVRHLMNRIIGAPHPHSITCLVLTFCIMCRLNIVL